MTARFEEAEIKELISEALRARGLKPKSVKLEHSSGGGDGREQWPEKFLASVEVES